MHMEGKHFLGDLGAHEKIILKRVLKNGFQECGRDSASSGLV
jgi:hypothetical protein